MAGPLAKRLNSVAYEPGLPRHLDDRIPFPVAHARVRPRLTPVNRNQSGAVRDGAADPTRQATHRMPPTDRLPRQLAAQPRRPTKNQNLHRPDSIRTWKQW